MLLVEEAEIKPFHGSSVPSESRRSGHYRQIGDRWRNWDPAALEPLLHPKGLGCSPWGYLWDVTHRTAYFRVPLRGAEILTLTAVSWARVPQADIPWFFLFSRAPARWRPLSTAYPLHSLTGGLTGMNHGHRHPSCAVMQVFCSGASA